MALPLVGRLDLVCQKLAENVVGEEQTVMGEAQGIAVKREQAARGQFLESGARSGSSGSREKRARRRARGKPSRRRRPSIMVSPSVSVRA